MCGVCGARHMTSVVYNKNLANNSLGLGVVRLGKGLSMSWPVLKRFTACASRPGCRCCMEDDRDEARNAPDGCGSGARSASAVEPTRCRRGLIGHTVEARQRGTPHRLPGAWSGSRAPSARRRFREELFPSLVFRAAYDALGRTHGERVDVEYVRLLHLAARTGERLVEATLRARLDARPPRLRGRPGPGASAGSHRPGGSTFPARISRSTTRCWPEVAVKVQGGGSQRGAAVHALRGDARS